jgi:tRNA dimethylallyltransferase
VGPTASGKSDLGIRLALAFDGEIINLDSVQVYRRIQIATAKVPPEERRGIPHHLIDIVEPTVNFTAGDFARIAGETITEIESRGRMAFLVGGTGFYLRALTKPLFESPRTDPLIRRRLTELKDSRGAEYLHRLVSRIDPGAGSRIRPRDWSRSMRALEYYFQTGTRISEAQPDTPAPSSQAARICVIALAPPREELYDRINRRAELMIEAGLVEEVRELIEDGVPPDAKAFQAHGYRRVVEYLQGRRTLEDALNQMKLDTRHYAKRQLSWWRTWEDVNWVQCFGDEDEAFERARDFVLTRTDPARNLTSDSQQ